MKEEFDVKKLVTSILILIPILYIIAGWYIGVNYSCKPVILGPYPDIPVVWSGQAFWDHP